MDYPSASPGYVGSVPSYATRRRLRAGYVAVFVVATLAAMPLAWWNFARGAGLSIKLPHLAWLALMVVVVLARDLSGIAALSRTSLRTTLLAFVAMAVVSVVALAYSDLSVAVPIVAKSLIYFTLFMALAAAVMMLPPTLLERVSRRSALIGLAGFLLVAQLTFMSLGRNFLAEYVQAGLSANVPALQFTFYPALFNYSDGTVVTRGDDDFVSTSLRNSLVGSFILYGVLLGAYASVRASLFNRAVRWGLWSMIALLVALSVSRSNWIAGLLIMGVVGMATLLPVLRRRRVSLAGVLAATTALALLIVAVVLSLESWAALLDAASERLSTLSEDGRLSMYADALRAISSQGAVFGHGVGATIDASGGVPVRVHNFFLALWYEIGLHGLLAGILFYLSIVIVWVRAFWGHVTGSRRWADGVSGAWVLALPVLPLFRSLISGGGGGFSPVEWCCLAFCFAEMARSRRVRSAGVPRPVTPAAAAGLSGAMR